MTAKQLNGVLAVSLVVTTGFGIWAYGTRPQRARPVAPADAANAQRAAPAGASSTEPSDPPAAQTGDAEQGAPVATWPAVARQGHLLGSSGARIRIVLFADYLCPHCRNVVPSVHALIKAYFGEVAVVYRNFPIFGDRSWAVAMAAECAARQGRFGEAYDALNGSYVVARPDWRAALADAAGVPDRAAYDACIAGEQTRSVVAADSAAARASSVTGTPAFVINGRLYQGEYSFERLRQLVEDARARPR